MSLANYSSFVCDGAYDVDIVLKDGVPYFRACEVTKILGYKNGRDAVLKHVREKYRVTKEALEATSEGGSKTLHPPHDLAVYISEPGLYSLIMRSKMQEAENFQDWVCETVLPAIRAVNKVNYCIFILQFLENLLQRDAFLLEIVYDLAFTPQFFCVVIH